MDEDKLGMKVKTDRYTDGEEKINLDWKCLERGNEEERIRTGPSSFIESGLNLKEDELWNNYTTKAEGCFEQHDANVADYRLQTNNAAYRSIVQTQTFILNTLTSCSTPVWAAAMCWLTEQRWSGSDCNTADNMQLIKNNELRGLNLLQPSDPLRSPLCSSDKHTSYNYI